MSGVLKKIFSGKSDEEVHLEFIKYGKGVFENKYVVKAKKQKDKWSIKTSAEFANFFVRRCLEKTSEEIDVKGVIVSTFDLTAEMDFEVEKVKKFMGIQQAVINTKISPEKILKLMDKYPRVFFALSFKTPGYELKIKPKSPKSAKPSSKGEKGPKANFCSLKTDDKDIVDDVLFDFPSFKEIEINHTMVL
jgi:hypothetical protein